MIYLVTNKQELFKDPDYTIISKEEALAKVQKWDVIQFDSETSGRDSHLCKLLCAQFGNDFANERIVIDTEYVNIAMFKTELETKLIIGQNLKFDIQFLYNHGIIPTKVYDTMIVEQLLYLGYPPAGKPGGISYALNAIAYRYLGIDIDKTVRGEIIWRGLDKSVILYAAGDVTYLEKIRDKQLQNLQKKGLIIAADLENRFVPVISYLEWCGIKLDQKKWTEKMNKDSQALNDAKIALDNFVTSLASTKYPGYTNEEKFCVQIETERPCTIDYCDVPKEYKIVPNSLFTEEAYSEYTGQSVYTFVKVHKPYPFIEIDTQGDLFSGFDTNPKCIINWASSRQVVQFAKFLGFDTTVKDKKTGESKESVLEKHLKGQKGINDHFLKLYFEYKEYEKVVSSFGQGHLDAVNPITGRIYTSWKQLGAASGRMSCGSSQSNTDLAKYKKIAASRCKYPNLQQLPSDSETRSCFVAENGNNWVSCDWAAAEARLAGDIYNDQAVKDIFLKGIDSHSMYAKIFFAQELANVDVNDVKDLRPDLRQKAKGPEFALNFGGGISAIMSSIQCTQEEAEQIIKNYEEGFKGTADFAKKASRSVKQLGYVEMCKETGHKMYWGDWEKWKGIEAKYRSSEWSWSDYKNKHKGTGDYIEKEVKEHFKAAAYWDRMGRNAPTQGTCACMLKHSQIMIFKWVVENGYFNKIKLCALIHDECNWEYPSEIEQFPNIVKMAMEQTASKYCKSLPIPADATIGDHWIH